MKAKYESMYIVAPVLSTDEVEKEQEKVLKVIDEFEGELIKTDVWGKKNLAYEINKYKEGHYFINYFIMDTQKIKELERHYRLNEDIIRYNILKLEELD
ncbi:MAG TPA: 30S ribosomal protein S6 [Candidatus Cloacimonadota bacterium]|jgi:small subunit ribosomal protein S6|nr:30S ribosomal protein S6 [Candidatus Cloacimonadales bacterium]HPY97009.1 30S ribosomal protein S6 [Candidatus Cloacimonadota bacterium]HQB41593.1 30S ribosomal protein S6 [Candidatus Cloacimonadota bacterium]